MKTCWFHLMPYRFLPENFENDYRSVWVVRRTALRTLPGGHMLHIESPDAVADAIVEFLSS